MKKKEKPIPKEAAVSKFASYSRLAHGEARRGKRTPTYISFLCAKERCVNPNAENFHKYGGRGIKFLFESFDLFKQVLGERPEGTTLDRIDSRGDYVKGNVRWATPREQRQNRFGNAVPPS